MAGTLTPALGIRGSRASPASSPALFLALHCDHPTAPPSRHLLAHVDQVSLGRGAAPAVVRKARELAISVADGWMSTRHAVLRRSGAGWIVEDSRSRNGTRLNGSPCTRAVLKDGDLLELGHTLFLFRASVQHAPDAPPDLDGAKLAAPAPGLATFSTLLAAEVGRLAAIARSTVPVVLHGASGSGKEVAARAIHQLSGRSGAFVAVNCGGIARNLVETELFGYRKGAFSGADEDRPGLMRAADKGTLFLDEIGDLPSPAQAPLLRALQEGEVLAVGATRPVKVDVRLLAATHHDLQKLVAEGAFRKDLFARISGFTVRLPALRDRREDLGLLAGEILRRAAPDLVERIALTPEAAEKLFLHSWPLNVRELEKCLSTALVLAAGHPIDVPHLPDWAQEPRAEETPSRAASEADLQQREELVRLLKEHRGNISSMARAMGKARMQVQRWLKRHGLEADAFRG